MSITPQEKIDSQINRDVKSPKLTDKFFTFLPHLTICFFLFWLASNCVTHVRNEFCGVLEEPFHNQVRLLEPGWHLKPPWKQKIQYYRTSPQQFQISEKVLSKDGVELSIKGTLSFQLNQEALPIVHQNWGSQGSLSKNCFQDSVRSTLSTSLTSYTLNEILSQQSQVLTDTSELAKSRLLESLDTHQASDAVNLRDLSLNQLILPKVTQESLHQAAAQRLPLAEEAVGSDAK